MSSPAKTEPGTLLTFGHGTLSQEQLVAMLTGAGVATVFDVRRFPGSRAHAHVRREALEDWLPRCKISYWWEPRLGGRRQLTRGVASPDTWWTVEAFRAYAEHTRSPEFVAALDDLAEQARDRAVAIMCSESVWWRCHRRLIADVAVLSRGMRVLHLMAGGRQAPHPPAAGARVRRDGIVIWDGG